MEWLLAVDCVGLPGMASTYRRCLSTLQRLSASEPDKVRRRASGKGFEYHFSLLPPLAQAALLKRTQATVKVARPKAPSPTYDRESLWNVWSRKTEKQRQAALEKVKALDAVRTLLCNGTKPIHAYATVAASHQVDRATLYRWMERAKQYDRSDWPAAMICRKICNTPQAACSREAWEFFKADYLRLEAPTLCQSFRRLERAAQEHGWQIPNRSTFDRRIRKEIPRSQLVLLRQGEQALYQLYPPLERSVADLSALEWINGDGYQHNLFVRFPDGSIERPKTWFWQDVYSRKILSWRVDKTENTDTLRQSFGQLIEQFGIPSHATIDNTRAAANKWMTGGVANRYRFKVKEDDPIGIMVQLGIKVHWTSVFNGKGSGQSKPIERMFGVGGIGEAVDKHPAFAGAYTGKNPLEKPENYGSTAIPLAQFEAILAQEIAAMNAQVGRRTEICAGSKSFDQAFAESYAANTIRKATASQRRLWLLPAEAIRVDKHGTFTLQAGSGFGIGKNRYGSDDLLNYAGQKVVVRFDPQALHSAVHVETLDGRYIGTADCLAAVAFDDNKMGREHTRNRKQFIKSTKQAAKAQKAMDALEAAAFMPAASEPEPPESAVVQGVFGQQQRPARTGTDGAVDSVFVSLTDAFQREIHAREKEKI